MKDFVVEFLAEDALPVEQVLISPAEFLLPLLGQPGLQLCCFARVRVAVSALGHRQDVDALAVVVNAKPMKLGWRVVKFLKERVVFKTIHASAVVD